MLWRCFGMGGSKWRWCRGGSPCDAEEICSIEREELPRRGDGLDAVRGARLNVMPSDQRDVATAGDYALAGSGTALSR